MLYWLLLEVTKNVLLINSSKFHMQHQNKKWQYLTIIAKERWHATD